MQVDLCLMKNLCDPYEKKPLSTVHLGRLAIQAKCENRMPSLALCLTATINERYAHWHDHGTVPAHHGRGWHQRRWDRSIYRCRWRARSDCTTCNSSRTKHRQLLFAL